MIRKNLSTLLLLFFISRNHQSQKRANMYFPKLAVLLSLLLFSLSSCRTDVTPRNNERGNPEGSPSDPGAPEIPKPQNIENELLKFSQDKKRMNAHLDDYDYLLKPDGSKGFIGYTFIRNDRARGLDKARKIVKSSRGRVWMKHLLKDSTTLKKDFPEFSDRIIADDAKSSYTRILGPTKTAEFLAMPDEDLLGFSKVGAPRSVKGELSKHRNGKIRQVKFWLMEWITLEGRYERETLHWQKNDPKNTLTDEQYFELQVFIRLHYNDHMMTGNGPNFLRGYGDKVYVVDTEEGNFMNVPGEN